jgi:hypothetical protein
MTHQQYIQLLSIDNTELLVSVCTMLSVLTNVAACSLDVLAAGA